MANKTAKLISSSAGKQTPWNFSINTDQSIANICQLWVCFLLLFPSSEHYKIHVPYKVHTVHHHHVEKVPIYKEIIKEVPKEIIKEVIKEVPVVKEVHVPVIKEVHVPVYKEVHVPVHVHHKEAEHHHDHIDLHSGWESSGGW